MQLHYDRFLLGKCEKGFFTLPRVTCVDDEAPAGTGDRARATSEGDASAQ